MGLVALVTQLGLEPGCERVSARLVPLVCGTRVAAVAAIAAGAAGMCICAALVEAGRWGAGTR